MAYCPILDFDHPGEICDSCGRPMTKDSSGGPDGAGYHTYDYWECNNPECEGEAA